MRYTKEDIIREYKKLRDRIGFPPNSKTFYEKTGVTKHAAEVAFGGEAFSKIQRAAGDIPNVFGRPGRNQDEFFFIYGKVVRDLQETPSTIEWKHRKISPTESAYRKILHLRWSEIPFAFRNWASDKPEWKDVVEICRNHCETQGREHIEDSPEAEGYYVYLMKSGKYYKLGRTTSVGRREYDVALQLPEPVKTVHFIKTDDPAGIEDYWHKRFKDKRKQGEWFDLSQTDITAFKLRKFM